MFTGNGGIYIFKKLIYTGTIVCSQPTPAINFSRFPSVTAYVLRAPELTTYRCPVRTTTEGLSALELPDHELPQLKLTNWQPR